MRRVTVTLPIDVVDDIDRRETNRSRFVAEAVVRELKRRRYEDFRRSIRNPHPEGEHVAEMGIADWGARSGNDDEALVDSRAGHAVRWAPGMGWTEPAE